MTHRRHLLLLVLIFLIAAALRIWSLSDAPPGLQHDEVFHAHDAFTVRQGNLQLWFTSNAGNEPLYIYLMALTTATIGDQALGIRFTALIAGMFALAFTYRWADRALGRRAALIAVAFMAVSFWPVWMSRVGLRSVLLPPMAALTLWLYTRALDYSVGARHASPLQNNLRFAVAGLALGLSLYTYPAANALLIIFAAFTVYLLILRRDLLARTWRGQIVFWGVAGLLYAPLLYAINAAGGYLRVQQTAVPLAALQAGDAKPLLLNTWQTLLMWTTRGDPIWRYNVSERPVFDPALSVVFLIGVGVALLMGLYGQAGDAKRRRTYAALIFLSLVLGIIPSAVTDTPPSFLRASAAMPATYLALALGFESARTGIGLFVKNVRLARSAWLLVVVALLIRSAITTTRDYFITWVGNEEVQRVYHTDLAEIAALLRTQDTPDHIVISSTFPHDLDPFIYAYTPHGDAVIHWYEGRSALVIPAGDAVHGIAGYSFLFVTREPQPSPRIQAMLDTLRLRETRTFPNGALAYQLYEMPPSGVFLQRYPPPVDQGAWVSGVLAFPPDDPDGTRTPLTLPVQFGDIIELIGYRSSTQVEAGGMIEVDLHFRVLRDITTPEPWAIFSHLLDADGNLIAGTDFLAVPPHTWHTGDVFIHLQDVSVPADLASGLYHLEIGLYTRTDGSRFPVMVDGQRMGDRLLLEAVEVTVP